MPCGKLKFDLEARMNAAPAGQPIPVVLVCQKGIPARRTVLSALRQPRILGEYSAISGLSAVLSADEIRRLAALPDVMLIEPVREARHCLDTATYWFGVTSARQEFGVTGDLDGNPGAYSTGDVVIAIVDTGIDPGHVDLGGGKVLGWFDAVNGARAPYDDNGHGTHVAGIAAGAGIGNPDYAGVAPGAALVGVKVLSGQGSGSSDQILAGLQWVYDNRERYGINVMNMSLSVKGCSDGTDAISQMVNALAEAGIIAVVSAGNDGPGPCTVGAPSAAAEAITVGAMADPGEGGFFLVDFSSRGPTLDGRIKPDIVGPGLEVMAPQAGTREDYVSFSGTSMSTPFVAGTAALMVAVNPAITPAEAKQILMQTARDWGVRGPDVDYGAGRLDAYAAVAAAGNLTGEGPAVPAHFSGVGFMPATGTQVLIDIEVADPALPLAATLIMLTWTPDDGPDFDLYLYDPSGLLAASSEGVSRQETISHRPASAGVYRLKIWSARGSGEFSIDLSVAAERVSVVRTV